ncbi:2,' 3'-cyclic nucleotide 2'-phosphodiesterase [Bombilactobacillus bombi]|nr:2,' 3'-cyclic nucleotide 2'-phosphodiesterase [Bombilactobacillus bombi]
MILYKTYQINNLMMEESTMPEVNILATTDIHGFIDNQKNSSALALLAIKQQYPNALLIDNGDFFIGNPLTSFFSEQSTVSPLVNFANDTAYDVMIPGNHDFDHGLNYLQKQAAALKADYLCCNVFTNAGQLVFKPFVIKEIAGVRVGIIGVLTSGMSMISDYSLLKGLIIKDALAELRKNVTQLRPQVDLLIVAYHGGIERSLQTGSPTTYATGEDETYKLVTSIEGIDGFICGHQHWINQGVVGSTGVIQCGYAGNCYGQLHFEISPQKDISVSTAIIETKDLPLSSTTYYDNNEYQQWLEAKVDVTQLTNFLQQKFNRKNLGIFLDLQGSTNQTLIDSFTIPYGVRIYHLNSQEYQQFSQRQWSLKVEDFAESTTDFRVLTNSYDIWDYRLEEQFVDNIFGEYLVYLGLTQEDLA